MTRVPRPTPQTVRVLEALLANPTRDHYGFELCKATMLKSGTLYPILARLEGSGVLISDWEQDVGDRSGPRRRYYRFSDDGAQDARVLMAQHGLDGKRRAAGGLRPILGDGR